MAEKVERPSGAGLKITVNAAKKEQIKTAIEGQVDHLILTNYGEILDGSFFSSEEFGWLLKEYKKADCPKISINIPSIIYNEDFSALEDSLHRSIEHGITSFRISNIGVLELLKKISEKEETGIEIHLGHSFNLFNTFSANLFNEYCSNGILLRGLEFSPELNLEEISSITSRILHKFSLKPEISIFGYGFFPVIHTRYKIDNLINGYERGNEYYLEDSKGYNFRITGDRKGDIIIFNSKRICTLFDLDKILQSKITNVIVDGMFHDNRELQRVIKIHREAINILKNKGTGSYHQFVSTLLEDNLFKDYSKGHIFRGVK